MKLFKIGDLIAKKTPSLLLWSFYNKEDLIYYCNDHHIRDKTVFLIKDKSLGLVLELDNTFKFFRQKGLIPIVLIKLLIDDKIVWTHEYICDDASNHIFNIL